MDVPAGMKNPTSGDLSVMLNSVVAAQAKQTFIYRGWEVNTPGNELAHTILRGAVNKHGQCIPNYHYEDLKSARVFTVNPLPMPALAGKNLNVCYTILQTLYKNLHKIFTSSLFYKRKQKLYGFSV